ncbi:MAG: hypothetical protein RL336_785 [Pseudomonadota bacterium]|jgi:aminoglycoside/choline kinase family phosphotransferase
MKKTLLQWCAQTLGCDVPALTVTALSGDAGFRRYYRLQHGNKSYIVADAPVEHIDNHAFVDIAQRLAAAGVNVPCIVGVDFAEGFLIQQDFGDDLLLGLLNDNTVDDYYSRALAMIVQMQATNCNGLPNYDEALLQREMALFPTWFVEKLLGISLDSNERELLDNTFACLTDAATQQPQAFVHRDFHSRNILCHDDELATIDFQDAVRGPITYDAVSLLKDCYIQWPADCVIQWLEDFHAALIEASIVSNETDFAKTLHDFHAMGLQRHIKVLGIFARLSLRDGKHGYLLDLPMVIDYTLEAAASLASDHAILGEFSTWFEARLVPLINLQEWSHGKR